MPFIHPTAVVDDNAVIGEDTRIWHFVHISSQAKIGKNCVLGQNVFIDKGVHVGNGVHVQNNVSIYNGVKIEDDVFLGPSCVFTNVINPRAFVDRKDQFKPTLVCKGVSIGANATIVCGHRLGEYSFIGAGTVVVSEVSPYAVMVGNPARHIGWICRCGLRLCSEGLHRCKACGATYKISETRCSPVA